MPRANPEPTRQLVSSALAGVTTLRFGPLRGRHLAFDVDDAAPRTPEAEGLKPPIPASPGRHDRVHGRSPKSTARLGTAHSRCSETTADVGERPRSHGNCNQNCHHRELPLHAAANPGGAPTALGKSLPRVTEGGLWTPDSPGRQRLRSGVIESRLTTTRTIHRTWSPANLPRMCCSPLLLKRS